MRLITLTLFLGSALAAFVVGIEAREPQDRSDTDPPGRIATLDVTLPDRRFEGVDETCSAIKPANVTPHHILNSSPPTGIRDRRAALDDFHEQFQIRFSQIKNRFGVSRIWQYDDSRTINIKHSARGGSVWVVAQSGIGVRMTSIPTFSNVDGEFTHEGFTFDESSLKDIARFPLLDELLYRQYTEEDHLDDEPQSGRFDNVNLFDEPIIGTEWTLLRLELIGLLKHPTPVSYQSRKVPTKDELTKVPTAPLNSFEQAAIDRLRTNPEQDVVADDGENVIQIVGALRASKNCQGCHKVNEGDLLGGLTYRLTRRR